MTDDEMRVDVCSPEATGTAGETDTSANDMDMSAADLEPTLAEGGDAAMSALIMRCENEKGAPFEPETLQALRKLFEERRDKWETLRGRLKKAGVNVADLDGLVKPKKERGDDLPGRALKYDEIEPWEEPVNGAGLLTELAGAIGSYVIMDAHQRDAVALWVVFAHAHDFFVCAALLIILSPTKRCGKTKLQETLARLTPRAQPTSGITAAALARVIEKDRPILFIDEFDTISNSSREMGESLRGQLNSSFNRNSAHVLKSVSLPGGGWDVRLFSTWAPTCIAGIGQAPDTVMDRSVVIALKRKLVSQKLNRLRGRDGGELAILARKAARWVADNEHRLRHAEPPPLAALNDRAADVWEPLFAIAEAAGGDWPTRAREAAKKLAGAQEVEAAETDLKLLLLKDIRDIFADEFPPGHAMHHERAEDAEHEGLYGPRLWTKDLLTKLHDLEERPWGTWGRAKKPMTGKALGDLLRPYGVRSGTVRIGLSTSKGYYLRAFEDAFARYLPASPISNRHSVTRAGKSEESDGFANVTSETCDGLENAGNASKSMGCDGVTFQKPGEARSEGYGAVDDEPSGGWDAETRT